MYSQSDTSSFVFSMNPHIKANHHRTHYFVQDFAHLNDLICELYKKKLIALAVDCNNYRHNF